MSKCKNEAIETLINNIKNTLNLSINYKTLLQSNRMFCTPEYIHKRCNIGDYYGGYKNV